MDNDVCGEITGSDDPESPVSLYVRSSEWRRSQLNVITSVGFAAAYKELVPVFQKSSGITVSTKHFASQGNGPDTIPAQLRAGAAADVVIMSKEGLGKLLAEGRIISASAVDLAQARLGVGPVPAEIQYLSIFSAAIVAGSQQVDAGQRLIHFLGSEAADAAIRRSGMDL